MSPFNSLLLEAVDWNKKQVVFNVETDAVHVVCINDPRHVFSSFKFLFLDEFI